MFQLDDLSKSIIGELQQGRKPYKQIATAIGVSENTVKARVKKLEEQGVMNISAYVDPEAMEGHNLLYIGVKLMDMNYVEKCEEISKLRRVVCVAVVTGRYDLMVTVHLKQGFGFLEFLNEELSHIDRIESVESFMVYKGVNLKVPYIVE